MITLGKNPEEKRAIQITKVKIRATEMLVEDAF